MAELEMHRGEGASEGAPSGGGPLGVLRHAFSDPKALVIVGGAVAIGVVLIAVRTSRMNANPATNPATAPVPGAPSPVSGATAGTGDLSALQDTLTQSIGNLSGQLNSQYMSEQGVLQQIQAGIGSTAGTSGSGGPGPTPTPTPNPAPTASPPGVSVGPPAPIRLPPPPPAPTPAAPPTPQPQYQTVGAWPNWNGSLFGIAQHTGIPLGQIERMNPQYSRNYNLIHPGDRVRIS